MLLCREGEQRMYGLDVQRRTDEKEHKGHVYNDHHDDDYY